MRGSCLGPEVEETGCDLEGMEAEVMGPVCVSREVAVCVFSLAGATFPCVCIVPRPFTMIHSHAVWWEISPACLTSLCISLYRNLSLGFMEL